MGSQVLKIQVANYCGRFKIQLPITRQNIVYSLSREIGSLKASEAAQVSSEVPHIQLLLSSDKKLFLQVPVNRSQTWEYGKLFPLSFPGSSNSCTVLITLKVGTWLRSSPCASRKKNLQIQDYLHLLHMSETIILRGVPFLTLLRWLWPMMLSQNQPLISFVLRFRPIAMASCARQYHYLLVVWPLTPPINTHQCNAGFYDNRQKFLDPPSAVPPLEVLFPECPLP